MKIAVVTGTSRRLGKAITEHLKNNGYFVYKITRSKGKFEKNTKEITIREYNSKSAIEASEIILEENNKIDLIINNASAFWTDNDDLNKYDENAHQLFDVHFHFPNMLVTSLIKNLSNNSSIINITDIFVDNPSDAHSTYCASKAALANISVSWAKKLGPNCRVNCIQPGPIKFLDSHTEEQKKNVLEQTIIKKEGGFEEIVKCVEFLLNSTFVTGESIKVDGGRSIIRG